MVKHTPTMHRALGLSSRIVISKRNPSLDEIAFILFN